MTMRRSEQQIDRLQAVREVVDEVLRDQQDQDTQRAGWIHLYGVSAIGALLALKRGLDPRLCAVTGMLHDIHTYRTGDPTDHARLGAAEAETILADLGCFSADEITTICRAISHHSLKDEVHGELDELLKDADVTQHYLCSPPEVVRLPVSSALTPTVAAVGARIQRWLRVADELGLASDSGMRSARDAGAA